jgi:hypothetical protein
VYGSEGFELPQLLCEEYFKFLQIQEMKNTSMNKMLLLIVAVVLTQDLIAQNRYTDSSVTCVAYWGRTDTRKFTFTKIKDKQLSDGSRTKSSISYDVSIKVLDSSATGYKLEWNQGNFSIDGKDNQQNLAVSMLMSGIKFIYNTDDVGSFKELLNWKEVRDFYVNMLKMQLSNTKQDGSAQAALDKMMASLATKESVEALMIREVQLLHSPYGLEYDKAGTMAETELPNLFGGKPFPATLKLSMASLLPSADAASIIIFQQVDKMKGRDALVSIIQQFAGKSSAAEISEAIKTIDVSDKTTYSFHLSTGWVSCIEFVRKVDLGGALQEERYTMEAIR